VMHADAAVFGRGEIAFAIGAMLAGVFVPRLATRHGADQAIILATVLCVASLALIVLLHAQPVYYAALLLFGFGNAGTRVARSALMFLAVPNHVMGRVGMFFSVYDRVLRTVLTYAMTLILAGASASVGFAVLLVVLIAAFVGAALTRKSVSSVALAPATAATA